MDEIRISVDRPSVIEAVYTEAQRIVDSLERMIETTRDDREKLTEACHAILTAVKKEFPETEWAIYKTINGWRLTIYTRQTVGDVNTVVSSVSGSLSGVPLDVDYIPLMESEREFSSEPTH